MLIATWLITFLLIIGVGIYSGTKITSSNQWSGGDKTMGAFAIGAVLGAWQIGGMSIVGAAQNGYTMGIAGCWYSIAGGVYFLVVGLLSKVLRENMVSEALPDFLARRYSVPLARLQSYIWVVFGCIYIPIQLKTIASIIQIVVPGFNSAAAMVCGVAIAAVYTGFAGMKGSSAIGRIVCIATYLLLIAFVVKNMAGFGGYGGLLAKLPKDYGKLIVPAMPTQQIIAWAVGGALSSAVMQAVLQPVLAARDAKASRNGCMIGYIFAAPICILTALIGMMGKASYSGLGDGASAFAWTINAFSSPFAAGIIFAVCTMIIAATMATMMMATGTILTNIYKNQINKKASDRQILRVSRWGTIILAFFTLIPAFLIPSAQLTNLFLTLTYSVTAPFSFCVIIGMLWKKVNSKAAAASVVVGILVAIAWVVLGLTSKLNIVYPVIAASYAVGIIVTLFTVRT